MGFPERLTEALAPGKPTYEELKQRLGLTSKSRITEWKQGKGSPAPEQFPVLADALGVRLDWLLGADAPMRASAEGAEVDAYRRIAGIVEATSGGAGALMATQDASRSEGCGTPGKAARAGP